MDKLALVAMLDAPAIMPPRSKAAPPPIMSLLRRWRESAHSRRLSELNDHILRDIGLTRDVLLCEAKPFWE